MRYRGKPAIYAKILEIATDKAKKTKIMYTANLSFNVYQKYLEHLISGSFGICQGEKNLRHEWQGHKICKDLQRIGQYVSYSKKGLNTWIGCNFQPF
jgi:predicted transcriptional regulator